MFDVRYITDEKDLLAAYRLNFEVFCEEQKWSWDANNESGLKIVMTDCGPIMDDDFNTEARWVGCFTKDNELVGAFRTSAPRKNKFEMELYTKIPERYHQARTVELTRLSISMKYRATPARILLLVKGFELMFKDGIDFAICTAIFPKPGDLYLRMGMDLDTNVKPFKYTPKDPAEVSLCVYPVSEFPIRAKVLNRIIDEMSNSAQKCEAMERESIPSVSFL